MRKWPWILSWVVLLAVVALCVRSGEARVVTVGEPGGAAVAALLPDSSPNDISQDLDADIQSQTEAVFSDSVGTIADPLPTDILNNIKAFDNYLITPDPSISYDSVDAIIMPASTQKPFSVSVESIVQDRLVYHVAFITLSDPSQLRSALAGGEYSRNTRMHTSLIAQENNALLAINGDYFSFRKNGVVIREGTLLRDTPSNKDALIIDAQGDLYVTNESDLDVTVLLESGIRQVFSFGPALVNGGEVLDMPDKYFISTRAREPRTGIGQRGPLEYVFICVDGRVPESDGISLTDFAQLFKDYGCSVAYNLDGGGSSTLFYNGAVVNHIQGGGQRSVSDIIYVTGAGGGQ